MSGVEMKDSGVEWLGEIPSHWQIASLRSICDSRGGFGFPIQLQGKLEGEIPFYKVSDMNLSANETVMSMANNYIDRLDLLALKAKTTPSGSTVFPKIGAAIHTNKKRILGYESVIDNNMIGIWVRDTNVCTDSYLYAYFQLMHLSQLVQEGPVPTISVRGLLSCILPLPPFHEQRAIASYLDTETAKIDALVNKTEQLNALLREKRVALISRAVTKGLDVGVEMKESGVEWLGEIPRHWEVWKLSHAFKQISSGTTPNTNDLRYFDGKVNWVTTSELRENTIKSTKSNVTMLALRDYPTLKIYPPGTLLIAMYGATIGRLGILGIPACTNQACCALSSSHVIDTEFGFYALYVGRNHIIQQSFGGGQPNINQEIIRSLKLPVPPLAEQRAIASYLDAETARIDRLIATNDQLIALLREKRTALISAAVTGKISVPLTPPPAPPGG